MNKLVETYCDVDDFCQLFIPHWQRLLLDNGEMKRNSRHSAANLGINYLIESTE